MQILVAVHEKLTGCVHYDHNKHKRNAQQETNYIDRNRLSLSRDNLTEEQREIRNEENRVRIRSVRAVIHNANRTIFDVLHLTMTQQLITIHIPILILVIWIKCVPIAKHSNIKRKHQDCGA